ncbi:MAG: replication initiation negative regulator SeqA [Colwellia sp.]
MKNIEIDEKLYQYIVANTQSIGENASSILRRLLDVDSTESEVVSPIVSEDKKPKITNTDTAAVKPKVEKKSKNTEQLSKPSVVKKISVGSNSENVFNFINKEELAMQRGAVGRFLLILAALYRAHPQHFNVVTEICGRDRLYFTYSEEELSASGSNTKPQQIPDSPFWVITNSNTTRKKMMLTKASILLGYSELDVEKIRELL